MATAQGCLDKAFDHVTNKDTNFIPTTLIKDSRTNKVYFVVGKKTFKRYIGSEKETGRNILIPTCSKRKFRLLDLKSDRIFPTMQDLVTGLPELPKYVMLTKPFKPAFKTKVPPLNENEVIQILDLNKRMTKFDHGVQEFVCKKVADSGEQTQFNLEIGFNGDFKIPKDGNFYPLSEIMRRYPTLPLKVTPAESIANGLVLAGSEININREVTLQYTIAVSVNKQQEESEVIFIPAQINPTDFLLATKLKKDKEMAKFYDDIVKQWKVFYLDQFQDVDDASFESEKLMRYPLLMVVKQPLKLPELKPPGEKAEEALKVKLKDKDKDKEKDNADSEDGYVNFNLGGSKGKNPKPIQRPLPQPPLDSPKVPPESPYVNMRPPQSPLHSPKVEPTQAMGVSDTNYYDGYFLPKQVGPNIKKVEDQGDENDFYEDAVSLRQESKEDQGEEYVDVLPPIILRQESKEKKGSAFDRPDSGPFEEPDFKPTSSEKNKSRKGSKSSTVGTRHMADLSTTELAKVFKNKDMPKIAKVIKKKDINGNFFYKEIDENVLRDQPFNATPLDIKICMNLKETLL